MAELIQINDLKAPELIPFTDTSELNLLNDGIFVAESPKVIRTAMDSGFQPLSLLVEDKYIKGQASDIISRSGNIPVYHGNQETLTKLTGYKLTQGILAVIKRRPLPEIKDILRDSKRIALLEDIMNQTNTGAIFRSAAALGFDAILLTNGCSDPLFRRSVRVSMGSVFQIPWTFIDGTSPEYIKTLQNAGFLVAAMALRSDTLAINDVRVTSADKLSVVLGTEGDGLKASTIDACNYTIKIPMSHGVDSLNVAAASAVAFWQLGNHE